MVDLSKKIPIDRVAALRNAGLGCQADWLAGDRSYEDLAAHPEWAFLAARLPGADIERLQEVVLRWFAPAQDDFLQPFDIRARQPRRKERPFWMRGEIFVAAITG